MGAIAQGGIRFLNQDVVRYHQLSEQSIEQVATRELAELQRREQRYRGLRPALDLKHKWVILVDDGLATGATMRVAIAAVRKLGAKKITMAIPVASPQTLAELRPWVDEAVCLMAPEPFNAVGQWYEEFGQTSDTEVLTLLQGAASAPNTSTDIPTATQH